MPTLDKYASSNKGVDGTSGGSSLIGIETNYTIAAGETILKGDFVAKVDVNDTTPEIQPAYTYEGVPYPLFPATQKSTTEYANSVTVNSNALVDMGNNRFVAVSNNTASTANLQLVNFNVNTTTGYYSTIDTHIQTGSLTLSGGVGAVHLGNDYVMVMYYSAGNTYYSVFYCPPTGAIVNISHETLYSTENSSYPKAVELSPNKFIVTASGAVLIATHDGSGGVTFSSSYLIPNAYDAKVSQLLKVSATEAWYLYVSTHSVDYPVCIVKIDYDDVLESLTLSARANVVEDATLTDLVITGVAAAYVDGYDFGIVATRSATNTNGNRLKTFHYDGTTLTIHYTDSDTLYSSVNGLSAHLYNDIRGNLYVTIFGDTKSASLLVNTSAKSTTVISELLMTSLYTGYEYPRPDGFVIGGENKVVVMAVRDSASDARVYTIKPDAIEELPYPVIHGVAKEGGSGGQTIAVYVPEL